MRTVSRSAVNRDRHPSSPPLVGQTLTQNVLPFLPQPLNHMVKYSASPLQTTSYNLYHILAASYITTEYNLWEPISFLWRKLTKNMFLSPYELVSEEKNTHKFIKQGYINRKYQCSLPALCLFAIVNTYSSSCQLTGSHYQRIQFCFWFLSHELFNQPPTNIGAVIVSNTLKCLIIEWLSTFNNCRKRKNWKEYECLPLIKFF